MNRERRQSNNYNPRHLESAVKAGIVTANDSRWNAPVYVFATARGYVVCPRKPLTGQAYYAIEPRKNPELIPSRVETELAGAR